ncbi:MAG TPA: 30S ribosomal protein S16 [Candidatus Saccharimonadales bacterium]|jgi:small subunit ribosomal protein S16|nr:30S ribosomal protein S16 [Candidatus Saccharimonadales bacterium]
MVIIRLSRFGRKKAPFYRIVAVDSSKKTTGKYLQVLGTWNPAKKELKFEKEKIQVWVKKGAQLSPTVKKFIEK